MRPSTSGFLAAFTLALALPIAAVGCGSSGDSGSSIPTVEVRGILAGSSPGWRIVDPSLAAPVGSLPSGTGAVLTTTALPSDPIVLSAGETVDRVIVSGGRILNVVSLVVSATAASIDSALEARLIHTRWAGGGASTPLAVGSAPISATGTSARIDLDFSLVFVGAAAFTDWGSDAGDVFTLRLRNTGASEITIDAAATEVIHASVPTHGSLLTLSPAPGLFAIETRPRAALFSTTGTASAIVALTPQARVAIRQALIVRAEVRDASGFPVPGAFVTVSAPGSTTPSISGQVGFDGVAEAQLFWQQAGSFTVSFSTGGVASSAVTTVDVGGVLARSTHGLASFPVLQGQFLSTDVYFDVRAALPTAGSTFQGATDTAFPDTLVIEASEDVPTGTFWLFSAGVAVRSDSPQATASYAVQVIAPSGAVVAQSQVQVATATLERAEFELIQTQPLVMTATAATADRVGPFQIAIQVISSSDAARGGIEVVTDRAAGAGFVVPGPTVFGVKGGTAYLASSPDPRR